MWVQDIDLRSNIVLADGLENSGGALHKLLELDSLHCSLEVEMKKSYDKSTAVSIFFLSWNDRKHFEYWRELNEKGWIGEYDGEFTFRITLAKLTTLLTKGYIGFFTKGWYMSEVFIFSAIIIFSSCPQSTSLFFALDALSETAIMQNSAASVDRGGEVKRLLGRTLWWQIYMTPSKMSCSQCNTQPRCLQEQSLRNWYSHLGVHLHLPWYWLEW